MAYRTLEVTLISAKDLKDVNFISKMAVYAVVSLSGDPRTRQRTSPDRMGGRNPSWDSTLRFTIPAEGDLARGLSLDVLLSTERALGDRDFGEVRVPLSELLDGADDGPLPVRFVSYQVRKITSGKPKGVLNFSYKLGACVAAPKTPAPAVISAPYPPLPAAVADEPMMDYSTGASYGAPPPYLPLVRYQRPPMYEYGYPPAGYVYGYGYRAPPPPQPRKNNLGMGMGAGLLGGAIGGLLIGDMVSDVAAYDAGDIDLQS
ncbi:hypothetical protein Cni_G09142 [Canna indica]|uniref:C2 domain-containing protein n=1 Tax=Canna indica TaxID=4628 RepID=A0AAQ3K1R4_9LILI|nr:hypothetical protein Cni_G09142 [Canna indica]